MLERSLRRTTPVRPVSTSLRPARRVRGLPAVGRPRPAWHLDRGARPSVLLARPCNRGLPGPRPRRRPRIRTSDRRARRGVGICGGRRTAGGAAAGALRQPDGSGAGGGAGAGRDPGFRRLSFGVEHRDAPVREPARAGASRPDLLRRSQRGCSGGEPVARPQLAGDGIRPRERPGARRTRCPSGSGPPGTGRAWGRVGPLRGGRPARCRAARGPRGDHEAVDAADARMADRHRGPGRGGGNRRAVAVG